MGRPVGRQLLRHRCLRGLGGGAVRITRKAGPDILRAVDDDRPALSARDATARELGRAEESAVDRDPRHRAPGVGRDILCKRSEEHTSELQSLMRIPYAVFCLKKKKT